ncbi:MAG: MMPL family transporter, partial [Victivallales bacterium]|nr:MMPL family transporter [Victivallales bacterium]
MMPRLRSSKPGIAVATLVFVGAATFLPFIFRDNSVSTNMDALLPNDPWIASHLDFLRNSQIGSMAAISLEAENDADPAKLARFAENFAELASKEPSVTEVFFRIPPEKAAAAVAFLCSRIPQILAPDELKKLKRVTSPAQVDLLLRAHYKEMMRPGALFRQKLTATDPLNLHEVIVEKLRSIGGNSGFRFHLREDGLWSDDNRHFLILVRTDAPISDAGRGATFVEALKRCLEKSQPSSDYRYIIMAGHRHAVDNRRFIQKDITVTMCVAALGFILMFAFLFRDWRAIFVFVVPFLGMGTAVGLTWLFFDAPSAIILGMGATVIGIALDYGIHVFVAAGDAANDSGVVIDPIDSQNSPVASSIHNGVSGDTTMDPVDTAVAGVARPIIFSALTTLGVFWAFFLSLSPGYHQLAFASTCGVAVSVWISLTCLPLLFKFGTTKPRTPNPIVARFAKLFTALAFTRDWHSKESAATPLKDAEHPTRGICGYVIFTWLAILAVCAGCAFTVEFQSNIRALDGIGQKLKNDEKAFRAIWGESSQAAVTVKSPTFEGAQKKQDKITKLALEAEIPGFQSLSMIWPSLSTRRSNVAEWDAYWSDERVEALKREFREKG